MVELYIGILKDLVRKDMKKVDLLLSFWDYCVESRAMTHSLTAKNFSTSYLKSLHEINR